MIYIMCVCDTFVIQGDPKGSKRFFKSGCGIQMSQATPTTFSLLFKHTHGGHKTGIGVPAVI